MKDLVVIGASGFGREVLDVIESINRSSGSPRYFVRGVVDDNPSEINRDRLNARGYKWLGSLDEWLADDNQDVYITGIGSPQIRKTIVERISGHRQPVEPLIHPAATVGSLLTVGYGTVICAGTIFTTNITVGQHVIINIGSTVGHDVVIGDYVTVNPLVAISGAVTLEEEAFVGVQALVLEGRTVGKAGVVGAAACVVKDVAPGTIVKGIPAK